MSYSKDAASGRRTRAGPTTYRVESSRIGYDGVFARVRIDEVRMPDGEVKEREVVEQDPAVALIPLDADGTVTLVRQYRHALGKRVLEAPAGKLDVEGEGLEEAARRELAEEVGLAADRLEALVRFENSAGWTDEYTVIYLATGVRPTAPPDGFVAEAEEAELEIERIPLDDALAMVDNGEITDAKTVIGLLLTHRRVTVLT